MHRCLQRHGISRLPDIEDGKGIKRKFKTYPIGYFHIDIAEVRTAEGRLYLFVAIDRTSKFAFTELHEKAFYDFPAEHWKHLRTSNPIESTFATVRHRTIRAKGCLSKATALAMVFKLVEAAQKSWRQLDGHNQLPKLVLGAKFTDGLELDTAVLQPKTAA